MSERVWKVCRSCWTSTLLHDFETVCLICGGEMQLTPLFPPKHKTWTTEQWRELEEASGD